MSTFPEIQVGDFAVLRVVDKTDIGAFLDWGQPKDLFLPFAEQTRKFHIDDDVLIYTYLDNNQRICASMRVDRNIDTSMPDFKTGDEVDLIIAAMTDLGFKAIVNGRYMGLLYSDEIYQPISYAQSLIGYIKKVRDDGKIDLQLTDPLEVGHTSAEPIADAIMKRLEAENGFLPVNDKTQASDIYDWFGVSRKKFKIALGGLYKRRLITVSPDGIRLVKKDGQ